MGRREMHLKEIVSSKHTVIGPSEKPGQILLDALEQSPHNRGIIEIFKSECSNQISDKGLGGICGVYPREPGEWDISVQEGFRIELDEEQHFNRYRGITLNSYIYDKEKIFSPEQLKEYKRFFAEYEHRCPRNDGWWSNQTANKQFGKASTDGDFSGNGSSRWKQRAFYDFLKDIASLVEGKPLIRVSVFDTVFVNGKKRYVGNLLKPNRNKPGRHMDYAKEILELIENRLKWWKG